MSRKMMYPVLCVASLLALIFVKPAFSMDYTHPHISQMEKVGEARMRVMLWDVYDATLFAPNGRWNADQPFALQLTYLRDLQGHKIADRSVQEMRKQGFGDEVKLAIWHTQMRRIFPDVSHGDILSGVFTADGHTVFYRDNIEIGRIKDTEFSRQFFSIWLSPNTSAPDVRLGLLGQSTEKGRRNNDIFERHSSHGASYTP